MRAAIFASSVLVAGAINSSYLTSRVLISGFFVFIIFVVWDACDSFKPKLAIKDKTGKIVGTISEEN